MVLTGKQNSSKAGLTNVVYWVRICSRSLPLFMSRRTKGKIGSHYWYTVATSGIFFFLRGDINTSARQPDIWIRVHEELHVEHIPHFLRVEDQDPLKEDHISWVNCDPLFQPGKDHIVFHTQAVMVGIIVLFLRSWKNGSNASFLPGMSDEVIRWHFNHPPFHNVLQGFVH